MDRPPTNPRIVAMMTVLFGKDWQQLDGDVAFEKAPVDFWVNAVQTMVSAADAADPIRQAIRDIVQGDSSSEQSASTIPTRADV